MILAKAVKPVYAPTDAFEKSIQENFHQVTNDWLDEKTCKLVAAAIASLKIFDSSWLDKEELLSTRTSYFFAPEMTASKGTMVWVSHPLFARDILENRKIQRTLSYPITFVTVPVANFLLSDYPVHFYVDMEQIKKENRDKLFVDVGGLMICEEDVALPQGCVQKTKVLHDDPNAAQEIYQTIIDIQKDETTKYAAKKIAPGVFQIEETERNLKPDMQVWDKLERKPGEIFYVERGENGEIIVEYEEGVQRKIPKSVFDQKFIVTSAIHGTDLETAIKQKMLKSRAVMNIFKDFDVSPEALKKLKIIVTDLDDRYAETDLQTMKLDKSLFETGDFFKNNFFVVAHEVVHFLSRLREKTQYFSDPEEILDFCLAVAFEMEHGNSIEDIWRKIYPKVEFHFQDKNKARKFFENLIEKAKKILQN